MRMCDVQINALSTLCEVTSEEEEKVLHFRIESLDRGELEKNRGHNERMNLFCGWILYGGYETT